MHPFQKDFINTSSKSDKIYHHGYHRFYPWFLAHFKDKPFRLLEIGIHREESLLLWSDNFEKAEIHGIDRDAYPEIEGAVAHQVDQSERSELKLFSKQFPEYFDLILDDGSHVPQHQIQTLEIFWSMLKPGGVYIIEDTETSYWGKSEIYGYLFDASKTNLIDYFSQLPHIINAEFSQKSSNKNIFSDIEMITYAANAIVLVKKDPVFASYYLRPYRFENSINSESLLARLKRKIKRLLRKI